jgi:hypothetical protein
MSKNIEKLLILDLAQTMNVIINYLEPFIVEILKNCSAARQIQILEYIILNRDFCEEDLKVKYVEL